MAVEQNEKIMTPIVLGLIALACWLGCGAVLLLDAGLGLGFGCPIAGLLIPGALACGLFGVITSLLCIGKVRATLVAATLVFNALTPFVMVGHAIWFAAHLRI